MALQCTQIGGGTTAILTVPNDGSAPNGWAVTAMLFCNTVVNPQDEIYTDDGDTFLEVHFCASGAATGPENLVLNNIPIPAGETFSFNDEKIILSPGDVINTSTTSPANITATVSYMAI
jgi:hypothetical protein